MHIIQSTENKALNPMHKLDYTVNSAYIANDKDLTIDEVREKICSIDEMLQRDSFGTTWIKLRRTTGRKPNPKKEADELFKEHLDELLKMTDTGADFNDTKEVIETEREGGGARSGTG